MPEPETYPNGPDDFPPGVVQPHKYPEHAAEVAGDNAEPKPEDTSDGTEPYNRELHNADH